MTIYYDVIAVTLFVFVFNALFQYDISLFVVKNCKIYYIIYNIGHVIDRKNFSTQHYLILRFVAGAINDFTTKEFQLFVYLTYFP